MTNALTISDLSKTVKESNLPSAKAEALEAAFMPFFEAAARHCETAFQIKVSNIGQTAEMGRARAERLALKDLRIQKEKVRKTIKEDALREGQAIDKIAKFLDSVTEPMEKYLLDQEEYGKRLQAKVQAEQRQMREIEAGNLLQYFPDGIDLGAIADEEFAKHLHFAGVQFKAIQDEQNRIENERIAKEQKEAAEREALRIENEGLRAEAAKIEAQRQKERAVAAKIQAEKDAELAKQRAEVERMERSERERIAAENRAAMERDNAEKERQRKEQAEKEAAEKAAMEAPDKEKLLAYAQDLQNCMKPYVLATESARVKCGLAAQKIAEAISILQS